MIKYLLGGNNYHLSVSNIYHDLARWSHGGGDGGLWRPKQAIKYYEQALEIEQTVWKKACQEVKRSIKSINDDNSNKTLVNSTQKKRTRSDTSLFLMNGNYFPTLTRIEKNTK